MTSIGSEEGKVNGGRKEQEKKSVQTIRTEGISLETGSLVLFV